MTNIYRVKIDNIDYHVEVGNATHNSSFYVRRISDGRVITDQYGDCNPLMDLYSNHRWHFIRGAARSSAELKCVRDAVKNILQNNSYPL